MHAFGIDAARLQGFKHSFGPRRRNDLVRHRVSAGIGVPPDLHLVEIAARIGIRHRIDHSVGFLRQGGHAFLEIDGETFFRTIRRDSHAVVGNRRGRRNRT